MSYLLINILLAVIPALSLVIYFYRQGNQKNEPVALIWKTFIIGFFSVFPTLIIELILDQFSGFGNSFQILVARAFIVAALVEEGIKLAVVRFYVFNRNEFDAVSDGIIYTITASMGFACFENILYSTGSMSTVLLRGFTAVPLHAIASGIMGYYIGYSKHSGTNTITKGFLIAILIHGLYDFLLFTGTALGFLVIPLLIIGGIRLRKLMKKALLLDRMSGHS